VDLGERLDSRVERRADAKREAGFRAGRRTKTAPRPAACAAPIC